MRKQLNRVEEIALSGRIATDNGGERRQIDLQIFEGLETVYFKSRQHVASYLNGESGLYFL